MSIIIMRCNFFWKVKMKLEQTQRSLLFLLPFKWAGNAESNFWNSLSGTSPFMGSSQSRYPKRSWSCVTSILHLSFLPNCCEMLKKGLAKNKQQNRLPEWDDIWISFLWALRFFTTTKLKISFFHCPQLPPKVAKSRENASQRVSMRAQSHFCCRTRLNSLVTLKRQCHTVELISSIR